MVNDVEGLFKINKYNTIEKAVVYINRPAIGGFEKGICNTGFYRKAVPKNW